ncbi:hypothetical protein CANMA_003843 [Candida margitis]|uniref:uncharacterized protein n=1 Tax=Candida margitis TaxID=1775924 RepID=UPI002226BB79|nr:uncharacterized protein CANMA_003843 [Candida margitis]KAI5961069.1 hypothetical protein CANMA_003843 [Candida margitis]
MSSNHLSIPQSPTTASTPASTAASTPFNPRTHRHKRSQAISGDFDGLGLFNIPPPPPVSSPGGPSAVASGTTAQSIPTHSSYYSHRSALSNSNVFGSPAINNNTNNSNSNSRTISASAPKERVVGFADTPRTKTDEEYELDRYFHFNNKDDFANPIDGEFAFPKSESDHSNEDTLLNYSTSPTSHGVTYTTNFRKSLSSPIQLSNKLSHSSLRQQGTPHLSQSPKHLTYQSSQQQQQQQQQQQSDVPDAMIDLDYILTANLHIGSHVHDDTIFSTDEFLGSPAIAEEEDTTVAEDRTILPSPALKNHDDIEEQDLQELQLDEEADAEPLAQPSNNFYSSTNSSSSSFNSVPPTQPQPSSASSSVPAQPPTPSFSTPTRQRSGAKAHRYQIFYDQSNRISNAMRGSAESIDRTNTNTPPLSAWSGLAPQSPAATATTSGIASQSVQATTITTPIQLQQQPASCKTRYLNHYSSLPTLKSKRSFSSIRYNELKKVSSPTREYYRLQASLSPSKYNANAPNTTLHLGNSINNSNNNSNSSNSINNSNSNNSINNSNSNNSINNNNTSAPLDLASTLHPPVPQCSTPSTLATQSTAESVSTAISNKRGDPSTSPISVNSEISSMAINEGKPITSQNAEVVEPDVKPAIVITTKDLEPSSSMPDSASTISPHLFPIPQSGHSNDNSISLQSESTISNKSSPRIATATATASAADLDTTSLGQVEETASNKQLNKNHPHIVLAPPPPSDVPTVQSSPISSSSSPTSSTFKQSGSSSPARKSDQSGKFSTTANKTYTRRPFSLAESNSIKQTQIPKPKTNLDAPMSKYDYHMYPHCKGELNKPVKHGDGSDRVSDLSNASSSFSSTGEGGAGVALSISLTNETKLKRGHGSATAGGTTAATRRRGHIRSKSNVEDSLSSAGMKRSSRFFDWLRKK